MQRVEMKVIKVITKQGAEKKIMMLPASVVEANLRVVQQEAPEVVVVEAQGAVVPVLLEVRVVLEVVAQVPQEVEEVAQVGAVVVVVAAVVTVIVVQKVTLTPRKRTKKKSLVVPVQTKTSHTAVIVCLTRPDCVVLTVRSLSSRI